MKKQLFLLATAMTIGLTACNRTDDVKPASTEETTAGTDKPFGAAAVATFIRQNTTDLTQGQARARSFAPTPDQIWVAFNIFDTNRSGQLSDTEVLKTLHQVGFEITVSQSNHLILKFDRNKSGSMDFDEFERFIQELRLTFAQLQWFINQASK